MNDPLVRADLAILAAAVPVIAYLLPRDTAVTRCAQRFRWTARRARVHHSRRLAVTRPPVPSTPRCAAPRPWAPEAPGAPGRDGRIPTDVPDRRRAVPVVRLLARLHWQRDSRSWTVHCRSMNGRKARLKVELDEAGGVVLAASVAGPWIMTGREVGRLRRALADAAITGGLLTADLPRRLRSRPDAESPQRRRRVVLDSTSGGYTERSDDSYPLGTAADGRREAGSEIDAPALRLSATHSPSLPKVA